MFRSAPRFIARQGALRAAPRAVTSLPARRSISTAPPAQKSRSWKSLVARLGLAGAIIYYYNTTDVFAEDPRQLAPVHALSSTTETGPESLPTIESITAERAQRKAVQQHLELQREKEAAQQQAARAEQQPAQLSGDDEAPEAAQDGGIEGLQAEADQQGAFNPETGEINWDCPCLGGMAHGPCGDEFKAAFSCFVYSKEEPKGMDCIDKFKDMQNCFRQYPEIYGSEIDNDDDDDDMTADAAADVSTPASSNTSEPALSGDNNTANNATDAPVANEPLKESKTKSVAPASSGPHSAAKVEQNRRELGLVPENYRPEEKAVKSQEETSESEALVPKAAHDGR
ncbi:Oxidoreductase [Didymella heteroderae]|uniref:Mitochondrial intermembrane space import and assembly protein 40 n=1 Tax=Didymella heteroderae TaxID=1769908 RepID=A0A9P4X0S5_9PLEO|nr:Oxidoreductase [Didymella heteroderae]